MNTNHLTPSMSLTHPGVSLPLPFSILTLITDSHFHFPGSNPVPKPHPYS